MRHFPLPTHRKMSMKEMNEMKEMMNKMEREEGPQTLSVEGLGTSNLLCQGEARYRCFHCGRFLQDQAVIWSGNDVQTIYFLGPRVEQWHLGLLRDALEMKYAGQPCWKQLA